MKYLLTALLVITLLCGCAQEVNEPPVLQTETAAQPVELGSLYAASAIESACDGSVRAFISEGTCTGVRAMGTERLLAFSNDGQTQLLLCSGEDCDIRLAQTVPYLVDLNAATTFVTENGIVFRDRASGALVILGVQLQEVKKIDFPENADEGFAVSADMQSLYYSTGADVRAMDLESGISRLVNSQHAQSLRLVSCSEDGSTLTCVAVQNDGTADTVLIDTTDGRTQERFQQVDDFRTAGGDWLMTVEGSFTEITFSIDDVISQIDWQGLQPQLVFPAIEKRALTAVTYSAQGAQIHYINLETGLREAMLELPGAKNVVPQLLEDGALWLLADGVADEPRTLLCWNIQASAITDDTDYTEQWYTAESPDVDGLALCKERADAIGSRFGVDVRIWQDAISVSDGYSLVEEYQTGVYASAFDELEVALSQYPDGFFAELMRGTTGGTLHICLLRSISGANGGAQLWLDGDAYILLPVGIGEQNVFHQELCHVLDTYVIGKTKAIDDWEQMNPSDFYYSGSYDVLLNSFDQYLSGENRAFINPYSMTFPREDRATLFSCAMMPGNGDIFASSVMQSKLSAVCTAIRESFGWKKSEEVFVWEQYLAE